MPAGMLQRGGTARGQRWALGALLVLPVLVYAVPALAGHVVDPGDDLIQNLPLRELVGADLRHGHLPALDPYIWSGTPLLGGWNAGAAYPLTWIFAVLPAGAAWTVNLVATWWAAGVGAYAFLRSSSLGILAAFVGAFSLIFGGAMTAQLSHIGLMEGFCWVPLQLLALRRIAAGRLGWVPILGALLALTILAGEPRAIDDAAIVVVLYAGWVLARTPGRARFGLAVLAAVALGVAIGAVQWLPGIDALHTSQRATSSYRLFAYESLPTRWLTLLVVPDLLGGSGSFGATPFLGGVNLAEVTGYAGLLPLGAAIGLLTRLRARGPLPEWLVWELVAVVGVLLALGSSTPLGHLLVHVPLYGSQRVQDRNLVEVDLALAFLLAHWLDSPRRVRVEAFAAALPGVAAAGLALWGIVDPASLLGWLGLPRRQPSGFAGALVPWLVLGAGEVVAVVLLTGGRRKAAGVATGFAVVDLLTLAVTSVVAVASGTVSAAAPPAVPVATSGVAAVGTRPRGALVVPGRFVVDDPHLEGGAALGALGQPDQNVDAGAESVGGYGAIVDGRYAEVTGTHVAIGGGQDTLAAAAVAGTTLDRLDTSVLLVPGGPLSGAGARRLRPDATSTWYLGPQVTLTSVEVRSGPAATEIGIESPAGTIAWHHVTVSGGAARWSGRADAVAVVVRSGGGSLLVGQVTVGEAGRPVTLGGALSAALQPPHWAYRGTDGPFAVYADTRAAGGVEVVGGRGTVRVLAGPAVDPSQVAVSSSAGVTVLRAAAAIPGWRATWTPARGATRQLSVRAAGAAQAVVVPAGAGVLRFSYDAPGLDAGLAISAVGLVGLGAAAVTSGRRRRGRGSGPGRGRPA